MCAQFEHNKVNLYDEILNPYSIFFKEINKNDIYQIIDENKLDSLTIKDSVLVAFNNNGEKLESNTGVVILSFEYKYMPNYIFEFIIENNKVIRATLLLNNKKYGYQHFYYKNKKGSISQSIGYYDNYWNGFSISYSSKGKNLITKLEYREMGNLLLKYSFFKKSRIVSKSYIYQNNKLLFCYEYNKRGRMTKITQYYNTEQKSYIYTNKYGFKL